MKKVFKNKSIKILIASLLCGLTCTYFNVIAMNNNKEKQQLLQSNNVNSNIRNTNNENQSKDLDANLNSINNITKINNNNINAKNTKNENATEVINQNDDDLNKRLEEKKVLFALFKHFDEITQEKEKEEDFDGVDKIIREMVSALKVREKYLEKNEIEAYNKKINEISAINDMQRKEVPKNKAFNELETYYSDGIIAIRDNNLKSAQDNLNSLINNKKKYEKNYLTVMNINYFNEEIKDLKESIQREKVIEKMKNYFNILDKQIKKEDYESALTTIEKINSYKERNISYIEDNKIEEYENKIEKFIESINTKKESKKIIEQLIDIYEETKTYINSENFLIASNKIGVMYNVLTKNEKKLEEYNIPKFKEEIKKLEETIKNKKTMKSKKNKKLS